MKNYKNRLDELSIILQKIPFKIDGKLLYLYHYFIREKEIKESRFKSTDQIEMKLASLKLNFVMHSRKSEVSND